MNSHTPEPRPPQADDDPSADELTRRLRSNLRSEAALLPVPRGAAVAITRARARRRNHRTLLASATAVVMLAAASYVVTVDTDAGKDEVATAARQAVVDPALGFDWTVTQGGLSFPESSSAGPSGLYAISTAPGTKLKDFPQGVPKAMYRLTDEGTWAPILLEDDDPKLGRVSQRGDTLYALSTGSVNSEDSTPTGSISTDGGESWSSVPLATATPPSDAVPWILYYSLDVASTAEKTVAMVTASVAIPYGALFPELSDGSGDYTVKTTDGGVDLIRLPAAELTPSPTGTGPQPPDEALRKDLAGRAASGEVVRTVSWAEMGITGPADLAPQRWAYLAEGNEWTEVAAPTSPTPTLSDFISLDSTDDSFVLTVNSMVDDTTGGSVSYRSVDGQTWELLETPEQHGQILAVGDSLVFVGFEFGGAAVQVSSDGGATWSALDLTALDPGLAHLSANGWVQAYSGPLGIALVVVDEDQASSRLFFSTDLDRWSTTNLDDVADDVSFGAVAVGTDRIVVGGHRDTGEEGSPERSATLTGVPRR